MPLDPDRTELLEQIVAEGDRRKRRRLLAGGGGVAAVVVLLVGVAIAGTGGGDRDDVATAADPSTTSVEATTTSTTAAPASTTTTIPGPSTCSAVDIARDLAIDVARVDDPRDCIDRWALTNICLASGDCPEGYSIVELADGRWVLLGQTLQTCVEELTGVGMPRSIADRVEGYFECFPEEEPACRNSVDPACGDPYWDLPAGFVNAPLEISLGAESLQATAGEVVTFTVAARDPDASAGICGVNLGGGELRSQNEVGCTQMLCHSTPPGYGPWDPPAPTAHDEPTFLERQAVWTEPGTYTISVNATSNQDCSVPSIFHSDAVATFTIEVHPA